MANETISADGSTASTQFQGEGTISVAGTFGGGSLTIEASFDGGTTWVADDTLTTAKTYSIKIGPCLLRTTLAGATSPSLVVSIVGNDIRKTTKYVLPGLGLEPGVGFPFTFPLTLS